MCLLNECSICYDTTKDHVLGVDEERVLSFVHDLREFIAIGVHRNWDAAQLKTYLSHLAPSKRSEYFNFAIRCLVCFVQANFVGPNLGDRLTSELSQNALSVPSLDASVYHSDYIDSNAKHVMLLNVAEIIFNCCIVDEASNMRWYCRTLTIRQRIFSDSAPVDMDCKHFNKLLSYIGSASIGDDLKAVLYMEAMQLLIQSRKLAVIQSTMGKICDLLGVTVTFEGCLGKRTRYQIKDVAQLKVNVACDKENRADELAVDIAPESQSTDHFLPTNVGLNDDVRLERTLFSEHSSTPMTLGPVQQNLLLLMCQEKLISSPTDCLKMEEILPLLDEVLLQNNNNNKQANYATTYTALYSRSKLETRDRRSIERSLRQCEHLIECYAKGDAWNKMQHFFECCVPPIWQVETLYADIQLNMGMVNSALDIYVKLQSWENVIVCYTVLNLRHKAADVIREQLKIKETVKLMCLLGDATDDATCYERAWEMSSHLSFRPQRHWAEHFYSHNQYEASIPHYEMSLALNTLQPDAWLKLGYAALQTEQWSLAVKAYKQYTSLESCFEAWNNLAQAHIKLSDKKSAYYAMVEALKCNYDSWKLWENFLCVSCALGLYNDTIRAYHRLLDLKDNHYVNEEILAALAAAAVSTARTTTTTTTTMTTTTTDVSTDADSDAIRKLFGRITANSKNVSRNGLIWEMYAELAKAPDERVQRLQKAFKVYVQHWQWNTDVAICKQLLVDFCSKMMRAALQMPDVQYGLLESIEMDVKSVLAVARKREWMSSDELKPVDDLLTQLQELIAKARENINANNNNN